MRRQALLGLNQTKGEIGNEAALRASSQLRAPWLGRSRAGCPQVLARLPSAPTQPQPVGAQRQRQPRALAAAPFPLPLLRPSRCALCRPHFKVKAQARFPRANRDCLPELKGTKGCCGLDRSRPFRTRAFCGGSEAGRLVSVFPGDQHEAGGGGRGSRRQQPFLVQLFPLPPVRGHRIQHRLQFYIDLHQRLK